jgi:hypothetical protein
MIFTVAGLASPPLFDIENRFRMDGTHEFRVVKKNSATQRSSASKARPCDPVLIAGPDVPSHPEMIRGRPQTNRKKWLRYVLAEPGMEWGSCVASMLRQPRSPMSKSAIPGVAGRPETAILWSELRIVHSPCCCLLVF